MKKIDSKFERGLLQMEIMIEHFKNTNRNNEDIFVYILWHP